MYKKILFSFFLIFLFPFVFQISSARYVIEQTYVIAKLNIDRCKPNVEFTNIIISKTGYPASPNKPYSITIHIKITEKNIARNDLSPDNIKIIVDNTRFSPVFNNFSLISENANEKIYKFSFSLIEGNHSLMIVIPEGLVEDKSGLQNESKHFSTDISTNCIH